ncbi:MAG: hypothetical protein Q8880_13495, partial [Bacteroidota bacterium]|nr:hypothetical protein [Bacteroidota bacterium]
RFIEEKYSNIGTRERYIKAFLRSYEFEVKNGKDLYSFNIEEAKDMLFSLSSVSPATLSSTKSIFTMYQRFAYEQRYVNNPANIYDLIDKDEILKMVAQLKQENRFLRSKQDLINIINLCQNPQDAVVFVLAYSGLKTNDILDLEVKNIDFESNTITVNNKTFSLEPYFINILEDAINQTIYIKNNGLNTDRLRSPELKLDLNSKYLLRGVQSSQREEGGKMTNQMVNSRIKRVVDSFGRTNDLEATFKDDIKKIEIAKDLHRQLITLTTVYYSGIFIKLQDIENQKGKLEAQDFINMRKEYGTTEGNWNNLQDRYYLWKKNI